MRPLDAAIVLALAILAADAMVQCSRLDAHGARLDAIEVVPRVAPAGVLPEGS